MEDPGSDIKADADERAPDFDALTPPEEVVRGDRTRDDFFDAVLGLDDPATASEVAERAGHGVDAAREYLDWFERMGIVTKVTDSPATYERNQEYLNWRRVQTLRREYTTEELLDLLRSESERADALAGETKTQTGRCRQKKRERVAGRPLARPQSSAGAASLPPSACFFVCESLPPSARICRSRSEASRWPVSSQSSLTRTVNSS